MNTDVTTGLWLVLVISTAVTLLCPIFYWLLIPNVESA